LIWIAYDSFTGMSKRFAESLGFPVFSVGDEPPDIGDGSIFLVTRSFRYGEVPDTTHTFIHNHLDKIVGVAVSGNRNWGLIYGKAGEVIEKEYNIPLVRKFEASGFDKDKQFVRDWLNKYNLERRD